jgi:hypothetical protein
VADPVHAVQKAIVAALAGISVVSDAGGSVAVPVYDHPPQDAALPYIGLAGKTIVQDDTYDGELQVISVYLSVWSNYRGQRQVDAIQGAIHARLHRAALALETGHAIQCRVASRTISEEPDGLTYQGAMTIEVMASPESP